jgi:aspartyl-tRNA synthetase
MDFLGTLKRTHYCGDIRVSDLDHDVVVMGWVNRRRDHGGLIFIDLRDLKGVLQVVINQETNPEAFAKAEKIRNEYVATRRNH